jgi:hypothetical protein
MGKAIGIALVPMPMQLLITPCFRSSVAPFFDTHSNIPAVGELGTATSRRGIRPAR